MILAIQVVRYLSDFLGFENDLAMCMALLEFPIGLTNLRQGIDVRDRNLQAPRGDQSGEFRKDIRRRGLVTAFSLNTVLRCCGEIDDRFY